LNQLHWDWYEYARGRAALPKFITASVMYFVPGEEKWHGAPSFAGVTSEQQKNYLSSPVVQPSSAFLAGALRTQIGAQEASDEYVYNPLDFSRGEIEQNVKGGELTDQTTSLAVNGDGLIYYSERVSKPTTLAGIPSAKLFLSTDVPDTDVVISISEIRADGSMVQLATGLARLRYRESLRHTSAYKPGDVVELNVDSFNFFARQLATGSRIRTIISAPNSPGLQKNFNSGGDVAYETAKDARTATVKIQIGGEQASYITLPIAAQ
jgi:uncharacterized protein